MLPYILALVVAVGSLALYLSAFFFPETHRKGDIVFSGVGLFYALVLWVCANRFTGAALLGQTASVALLTWFGWQTLTLRRELVPIERRTGWGPKTIQQGLGRLMGGLMKLPGDLVGAFSRSKPTPIAPPTSVPEGEATPTEMPTGTDKTTVAPEVAAAASPVVTEEPQIAPEPPTPEVPTAIAVTETAPSPEVIEPEAPPTGVTEGQAAQPAIASEAELPETEGPIEVETAEAAEDWETDETGELWEEEAQPAAERTPQAPAKPKRENVFTVLKDALTALSPFKKRPSRPMITLNRPDAGDEPEVEAEVEPEVEAEIETEIEAKEVESEVEAEVEADNEAEAAEPVVEAEIETEVEVEIEAKVTPDVAAGTESAGEAFAAVDQDQSEVDDWEAEASPVVANTSDVLAEEGLATSAASASKESDAARLEVPGELETSKETDLGPDGAAAVAVSAEVEVAQSDLDVIDEPVPEAPIDVEARAVAASDDDWADAAIDKSDDDWVDEATGKSASDLDRESKPETSH